jgi:HAD superfamily 5'-nucleotidase-like hydrolase
MSHDDVLSRLPGPPPAERGIFCNRTLNLRSIRAVGYDMDYTLIHYHVEEWERRAYRHVRQKLADQGWPVASLEFDPTLVIRGLVIDRKLGNIVKSNRFGYVKRAYHGLEPLPFDAQRKTYARVVVDLSEPRWEFLNTLFSLSEGCLYAQLVALLDEGELPGVMGYDDLYSQVKTHLNEAHMEGQLKSEIIADPERFVDLDPEVALALLDQKAAGKKLLLITNSEWPYTRDIMAYAFDRYLPGKMTWRGLFDLIIVAARKPLFFTGRAPVFQVVDEEGLLRPTVSGIPEPGAYLGGNAEQVETHLGYSGAEILYVGDHAYGDVHQSKNIWRWRTALIVREIEEELRALERFRPSQRKLTELMSRKDALDRAIAQARVTIRRIDRGRPDPDNPSRRAFQALQDRLRAEMESLDAEISPIARSATTLMSERWGLLMRTGKDKSLMARHVERHADIYTSRVSNFLCETPYAYLSSPRGSLPHDPVR